ncbi:MULTISPECIES: uracil-DNA glycosylase [unclassified Pseudomonas]|uniref:uracil-DNA glycosylase n=1 Tax=unclassified Pseudomonas TaxID=196821 RepID=UPI0009EC3284|nr:MULTISPECIES: uracil-DNA glycosylase [unclassified Pseudomonas]
MKPKEFARRLSAVTTSNSFNPYSQVCSAFDVKAADKIRFQLLLGMLEKAASVEVDAIWIGRDLGYRGGRRTGLALTDEIHAEEYAERWSLCAQRTTKGEPCKERTASVIWDALRCIEDNIFLWNVFPLHPHEVGEPFSNRSHNAAERKIGEEILTELVAILRPRRLIAVGNDAVSSISRVAPKIASAKVRHPSYGGQNIFLKQIETLYGVSCLPIMQGELF